MSIAIENMKPISSILQNIFPYGSILEPKFKHMRTCPVTHKGSIVGGGYSNRTRATQFNPTGKVRKQPNLQKKRVYVPELKKYMNLVLSTKAIKTINKNGAFATLKKAGII